MSPAVDNFPSTFHALPCYRGLWKSGGFRATISALETIVEQRLRCPKIANNKVVMKKRVSPVLSLVYSKT